MVVALHKLLSEADAVVTYNGDRYDIPKAMGEFVLEGLMPPPPPTSIDLMKAVKKLGFVMNRLAFIGPLLKVGQKVKHEGRSEEHTSELQSLMRISYAVFCLKKNTNNHSLPIHYI